MNDRPQDKFGKAVRKAVDDLIREVDALAIRESCQKDPAYSTLEAVDELKKSRCACKDHVAKDTAEDIEQSCESLPRTKEEAGELLDGLHKIAQEVDPQFYAEVQRKRAVKEASTENLIKEFTGKAINVYPELYKTKASNNDYVEMLLGELLFRKGLVTREQVLQADAIRSQLKTTLGRVLKEMGLITADDLLRILIEVKGD